MNTVLYRKQDRIAWVTLNRPDAMNAIDRETNAELWRVWRDFDGDADVDVAILTGNGPSFCAGADLRSYIPEWLGRSALDIRRNASTGLGGITRGLHRIYKPVIAAVNGHALAGGFELALACDIRIASRSAQFGSFEVRRGFHHGDGGIVRLVAILGTGRALELVLTGRAVYAEEALAIGLVSRVVPEEELLAEAERYARMILENGQIAVRSAKETILEVIGRPIDDALRLEAIYGYSSAGDPEDVRRRLADFFKKRSDDGG
ncbi:enoyl-CoA hydratase/isomerase family protein [Sorangium sp. So ce321]|uniref:enoyl-CoA hydratase/isomerase family protein n=1 Tax=Sorangium sp. So ce321 TaxID=3133300 RepID=UPI003F6288D7